MSLKEIIDIKNNSIISIVGCGGKTTLMYLLANELKTDNKVLVSTTTKIFSPTKDEVDYLAIGENEYNSMKVNMKNGVYAYGKSISKENKLIGIEKNFIKTLTKDFKYILLEADGSKRKPIKGWNDTEPVICKETNLTIGVMTVESLGLEINDDNVHRVCEFNSLTNSFTGEIININHFLKVIFNNEGLFKYSKGKRILFLNKMEKIDENNLKLLIKEIIKRNEKDKLLDKIIYGSLKNKIYNKII